MTKHTIHRDGCPKCKKKVEPPVPDALPGSQLGNRVLVHLLRELEQTEQYKSPGEHWPEFAKKLRRLIGDAIRLWYRQDELPAKTYALAKTACTSGWRH